MKVFKFSSLLCVLGILAAGPSSAAKESHIIMGAGPSTAVVSEFFQAFAATPEGSLYRFEVPPHSIKHAGGLKAADSNVFGRTGRPLEAEEKEPGRREIPLARVPIAFVADPDSRPESITISQLVAIYGRKIRNWSDVGGADGPIRLVGRESTEAVFTVLKNLVPALTRVEFDLVLLKDHQVTQMFETHDRAGVLSFGARANFPPEAVLPVDGFEAGMALGLVYNIKNEDHKLVKAVKAYAASEEWKARVKDLGLLPVLDPAH